VNPESHKTRTLWLVGILHAFTHVYHVALLPLYLRMRDDLHLGEVDRATALVSAMMAAYFLPSYPMGLIADRFGRKRLLAWGLFVNALGFVGLSFATGFATALVCVVAAGLGGSCFHPAATALVARLYPVGTGRALGLIGAGASVGFLAGSFCSGALADWTDNWRVPVLAFGVAGVAASGLFARLAEEGPPSRETKAAASATKLFPRGMFVAVFAAMALLFCLRDFAGNGLGTLSSLFLQQARGYSAKEAGLALSAIFVLAPLGSPLFGHLGDSHRLSWAAGLIVVSAALFALFPHLPAGWLVWAFVFYGFLFISTYPIVEAELMLSVPDALRGRFFGLFITVGGLVGNLSHWAVGAWVHRLGADTVRAPAYVPVFSTLAGMLLASLAGLIGLRWFRAHRGEYVT
jgi:MFS family permease